VNPNWPGLGGTNGQVLAKTPRLVDTDESSPPGTMPNVSVRELREALEEPTQVLSEADAKSRFFNFE
jgi:hypothetical protein